METKKCNVCGKEKFLTHFYTNRKTCKPCYKDKVRDYVHTKKGKVTIIYKDMKARVLGQTGRSDLYLGLPICKKQEFYDFSLNDPIFNALFDKWKETGWDEEYKPSIDRKVPKEGYVLSNIRWVNYKDNISRNIDPDKYELNDDGSLPF
jgi:hypothetical protein